MVMMGRALFQKPLAFLRQLSILACAAAVFYGVSLVALAYLPGAGAGLVGPSVLYLGLIAASVLCVRAYQSVAHHRAVAQFAERVGELEGQNRLLDFKSRMESRLVEATSSVHLEREVNKRERRIQQLAYEGKLSALRQASDLEALQRELEYYKREHHRLHQENLWLKSSLRQNHIDLAYLKERVDRHLTGARPTLVSRVRSLFSLSSPTPAIVKLARALDERSTARPEGQPDAPMLPAR